MKHTYCLITLPLLLHPVAAQAQGEWGEPRTRSQVMAAEASYHFTVEKRRDNQCERFGCLIVINETRDFTMTGMFLDTAFMKGGPPVWSKNILYSPGIYPMRATSFPTPFKLEQACEVPARFEFRHADRRRTATVRTKVSLCQREGQPFVRLRVRVTPGGRVILDDGEAQ